MLPRLLSPLLLALAAAAPPAVPEKWSDFNQYEVVGFSSSHIALREYYTPDRGPDGDPVDCGYRGLAGKVVTANISAREMIQLPARGLVLHLLPYEAEKLAQLRRPHQSTAVYRAVTRRAACGEEEGAARETARVHREFKAAGIDMETPPVMERVLRRVDLSSCRDPEHEEGCVQHGRIKVAGTVLELKLAVRTGDGRMDLSGDLRTGKKGFRFQLGHSSANSFTLLPLEIYRSGRRTMLMFQFAEVFTSDRRRTAYFMVF